MQATTTTTKRHNLHCDKFKTNSARAARPSAANKTPNYICMLVVRHIEKPAVVGMSGASHKLVGGMNRTHARVSHKFVLNNAQSSTTRQCLCEGDQMRNTVCPRPIPPSNHERPCVHDCLMQMIAVSLPVACMPESHRHNQYPVAVIVSATVTCKPRGNPPCCVHICLKTPPVSHHTHCPANIV